jgi:hypothetical protein
MLEMISRKIEIEEFLEKVARDAALRSQLADWLAYYSRGQRGRDFAEERINWFRTSIHDLPTDSRKVIEDWLSDLTEKLLK